MGLNFSQLVQQEKTKAVAENGGFNSLHEIYGVLAEEMDEFFDIVKMKPAERNGDDLLKEFVQIAAMVELAAEELGLVEKNEASGLEEIYVNQLNNIRSKVRNFVQGVVKTKAKVQVGKESDTNLNLIVNRELYNELITSIVEPVDEYLFPT